MPDNLWISITQTLGFPALVVFLIIVGKLVPGWAYERAVKDNDRMTAVLEEKALPALVASNTLLEEMRRALAREDARQALLPRDTRRTFRDDAQDEARHRDDDPR